jgi:hypothetical protein
MLGTQRARKLKVELEPSEGIEPPSSTYEVAALPLSYLGTTAGDFGAVGESSWVAAGQHGVAAS